MLTAWAYVGNQSECWAHLAGSQVPCLWMTHKLTGSLMLSSNPGLALCLMRVCQLQEVQSFWNWPA